jgi:membrane protein
MSKEVEEKLLNIPVINIIVRVFRRIILPGFNGLSLYDLLEIYITGIIKGTFSSRASSIAYSFFIAIFPFLLFILNLISYIKVEGFQQRFLTFIEELLPPQTHDFFYPVIEDIAINQRTGLTYFVLFLSLFLAANGVNAIFSAFEGSYLVKINRAFFKQFFISIAVAICLSVLMLVTIGVILYGEYIISELKGSDFISDDIFWINVFQVVVFVGMVYVIIAGLYHFGVKKGRHTRFFSIGALMTTLLFLLTTYLFGIYINNFSNYNELYGSIGALMIMLFYIWINSNLLLLGFELNISLQRLKEKQQPEE